MQDSDQEYPLKQPSRGHHAFDGFHGDEDEDEKIQEPTEPVPSRQTRAPLHQREAPTRPALPRATLQKTLVVALIAGILATLQGVVFTLANSALYQQAAQFSANPSKLPIGVATSILGLFCLTSFISFVIYFVAGFVIGMLAVARKMGFLGGFIAGVVAYLFGFLIHLFPGYPDTASSSLNGGVVGIGGGIITAIIIVVLLALLSALAGLLGAWLATRNHAYYYYSREEA